MKGYLLLANGQLYEGTLMGAAKPVMAELVFTTAMTGYLETLTDPSYEGEIVIQTFPTIGNYGVIPEDFESPRPRLSAYIVRELCDEPSNFRCQGKLDDYLKAQGIPCLTGVDTRALTRVIRNAGVMNAALLTEKPENPEEICAQLKVLPFHPSIQDVTCPRRSGESTTSSSGTSAQRRTSSVNSKSAAVRSRLFRRARRRRKS